MSKIDEIETIKLQNIEWDNQPYQRHPTEEGTLNITSQIRYLINCGRVGKNSVVSHLKYRWICPIELTMYIIKVSKTDPFRQGVTIRISATNNDLCPFAAFTSYLQARGSALVPLFPWSVLSWCVISWYLVPLSVFHWEEL